MPDALIRPRARQTTASPVRPTLRRARPGAARSGRRDSTRLDADGTLDAQLERVLVLREVVRHGERRGLGGVADHQGHPGQLVHAVRVGHGQAGPPVLPRAAGLRRCRRARRTSPPPVSQPALADRDEARAPQVVRRGQPRLTRADDDHRRRRPGSSPPPHRRARLDRRVSCGRSSCSEAFPGASIARQRTRSPDRSRPAAGPARGGMGPCSTTCPRRSSSVRRPGRCPPAPPTPCAPSRTGAAAADGVAAALGAAAAVAQRRRGARDPPARRRSAATSSGTPSSTSARQTSTKAELVVDPAHRRAGVGRALLTRALAETAVVPGRTLRVWAHGDLPAARAFARGPGHGRRARAAADARRPDGPADRARPRCRRGSRCGRSSRVATRRRGAA